ncbi:MAG: cytochrome P450 [Pseudomonadota bacterium]
MQEPGGSGSGAVSAHGLGAEDSIWFVLSALLKDPVNPMPMISRMSERYGGAIPLRFGDQRLIFLSDVSHFEHVLVKGAEKYHKYFDGLKPVFGNSMITIDGALWQKIRVPQQAAFHPSKFEEYVPYFLKAIDSKTARWEEHARSGRDVEMVEETWTMAADMICQALFDRQVPFNPHVIFKYVKTYTNVANHQTIRREQQRTGRIEIEDPTSAASAMDAWQSVPDQVIAAPSVENRVETLLSSMLDAEADPEFPEFDHAQVVDEMKQYLWAGTETTALTLAWCLYTLSQKPEVADKIRAEVDATCGKEDPTWSDFQKLVYTRRVIQETMRMYPPVWAFIRRAVEDDEIDGVAIKKGDAVALCSYAVHHSPKYWTDPDVFDPDRFAPDRMKKRARYSYLPFAAGRRSCIGGAMSQVENGLALAMLLRKFDVEYTGPNPAPIAPTVTLTPRGGLYFKIHARS